MICPPFTGCLVKISQVGKTPGRFFKRNYYVGKKLFYCACSCKSKPASFIIFKTLKFTSE